MKPTIRTIKKEIKNLRNFIDTTDDVISARVAYAVESALVWATTNTKEIYLPLKDVLINVHILKEEIRDLDKEKLHD
jgi:hypothetical protein